ncbi:MJ050-like PP-loop ATpase [Cryptosporidium xiaoi]|uniref:Diphthine--ammonia ligase n=1 Tax=Cryptosporidium xiaoi TaxID=659607 RepID=A0AAV9XUU6_9CRYT
MKVIGLISGGKDSIFNLLCCRQLGFEIVVLANLTPNGDLIELDSYMYQSIGKELVPLISECLEIPVVRRSISGRAVNQNIDYRNTEGDEVEDLYLILKTIQETYPDVGGISCGAVMSNYQRNRLEEVAYRLNLNSYCFMWMLPEYALLKSIVDSNLRSMIVKVASFGLGENYIGKFVSDCLESFDSIQKNVCSDFHCCGEGGEYETITLDGPSILFKNKYISIEEYNSVCLDSNPYAPVHVLIPAKYSLMNKGKSDDSRGYCLPFIDPSNCLEYYILRTGKYILLETENKQLEGTDSSSEKDIINYEFPDNFFDVNVFETNKTFILNFTTEFSENKELYDKVRSVFLENVCNKAWFIGCNAVTLNATLFLSEMDRIASNFNILNLLSNIWKNIYFGTHNANWSPAINLGYVNCQNKISNDFIRYNIIINKHSNDNKYKYIYNYSSSSISSYGTSMPKSFSNNISIMKYKDHLFLTSFKIEDQKINNINSSFIISSCIYGIIPHSQLPPSDEQIINFIRKNEKLYNNEEISISYSRLSIELSLAVRSFRCDLNSVLYNSSLLSSNNRVDFRYDIFNITHMWIVEISDTNIPLLKISQFFKSLIGMYTSNEEHSLNEWSDIHKYICNNSVEYIDPIVVPVVTDSYLNFDSKCKVTPLSFFKSDYNNYYSIKETENNAYWNFEARIVDSTDHAIFWLFSLDSGTIITQNNIDDVFNELLLIINTIITEKFNFTLSESNILFSKLFVKRNYYNVVISNVKNAKILYSSTIIPVKCLYNDSPLEYTLVLSE